ncbi:MAG: hypothetical protein ACYT04_78615, partial [Nostoc sp.]
PSLTQAPSQDYPFTIEAMSRDGYPSTTQGSLEVSPVGFVKFTAIPQQQTIPYKNRWLPNWRSNSGSFQLIFKNTSNLQQQLNVILQGRDQHQLTPRISPENADLSLGETTKIILEVKTKRFWVGWSKI